VQLPEAAQLLNVCPHICCAAVWASVAHLACITGTVQPAGMSRSLPLHLRNPAAMLSKSLHKSCACLGCCMVCLCPGCCVVCLHLGCCVVCLCPGCCVVCLCPGCHPASASNLAPFGTRAAHAYAHHALAYMHAHTHTHICTRTHKHLCRMHRSSSQERRHHPRWGSKAWLSRISRKWSSSRTTDRGSPVGAKQPRASARAVMREHLLVKVGTEGAVRARVSCVCLCVRACAHVCACVSLCAPAHTRLTHTAHKCSQAPALS